MIADSEKDVNKLRWCSYYRKGEKHIFTSQRPLICPFCYRRRLGESLAAFSRQALKKTEEDRRAGLLLREAAIQSGRLRTDSLL